MPKEKNIGKRIRELRLSKNMSQDRFGYKLGVSGKSISAYENGVCIPSLKVMEAISTIYGDNVVSTLDRTTLISKINTLKSILDAVERDLLEGLSL